MPGNAVEWTHQFEHLIQHLIDHWPEIEREAFFRTLQVIDFLFAPRLILQQMMIAGTLHAGIITVSNLRKVFEMVSRRITKYGRSKRRIEQCMAEANTYPEWKRYAEELDALDNLDQWRLNEESALYDLKILKKRMADIRSMMNGEDIFHMMFRLRGSLARDQFGMQEVGLFTRASAGTKVIVEEYHLLITSALNYICDHHDDEVPTDAKLAFFNETRHSYGRTALLLSGGASLGMYHFGVLKTLHNQNLLPRVISGASAGSLVAAVIGVRNDKQVADLLNITEPEEYQKNNMRFDFFGMKKRETSQLQYLLPQSFRWLGDALISYFIDNDSPLRLDTDHLKHVTIANVGLMTFQEAFDHTGRILNITVAPNNKYDPPRLLNYLTAPHICIWSAAVASCAIPGVFDSIPLMTKEPSGEFHPESEWTRTGQTADEVGEASYTDGSIERDLPMQQISELFNVNHFIVSQVNPHSALLSTLSVHTNIWTSPIYGMIVGYLRFLQNQCRDWLKNIIDLTVYRSDESAWSAKRGFTQLLTQDYEGRSHDITIMPWKGEHTVVSAFACLIRNNDAREFLRIQKVGQRNCWPKMSRIRAHCSVEVTLDNCVQRLRKRLTIENYNKRIASETEKGLDRTPSFYTSRSIVNLSGLSVSDPIPRVSTMGQQKLKRRVSSNQSLNSNHSGGSGGTLGIDIENYQDEDFYSPVEGRSVELKGFGSLKRSDHSNVTHPQPLPFTRSKSDPTSMTNLHDPSILSRGSSNEIPEFSNPNYEQYEDIEENNSAKFNKTTNMTNFYYKKASKSDENINTSLA